MAPFKREAGEHMLEYMCGTTHYIYYQMHGFIIEMCGCILYYVPE